MFRSVLTHTNIASSLRTRQIPSASLFRRWLNINVLTTPNENALKYMSVDGELFQTPGSKSIVIKNTDNTLISNCKLAKKIFEDCPGAESLMIGDDFVSVNKDSMVHWNQITPEVTKILLNHLQSGESVISDDFHAIREASEQAGGGYKVNTPKFEYDEDAQEVSDIIDELIDTRIRPAILEDGGDVDYLGWDPKNGTVYLRLKGSCSSCSSSEVTLKYGIESMLMHYVDEVKEVIQLLDPTQEIALKEFDKLEKKLAFDI